MKIHEYQGKEILRKFGVTTPRGIPAFSVDEAIKAAETLGGKVWVVKASPAFEVVATNDMREPIFASPAVAAGRLFLRTTRHLYCIGK